MKVINLFAFRATQPRDMKNAKDPIGPDNIETIRRESYGADRVICAWGVNAVETPGYEEVTHALRSRPLYCLGTTKGGHPRHPLYVRGDTEPEPYGLEVMA